MNLFLCGKLLLKLGAWKPLSIIIIVLLSLALLSHNSDFLCIITSHDHNKTVPCDQARLYEPASLITPNEHNRNIAKYKSMYVLGDLNVYFYRAFVDDRTSPVIIRVFGVQNKGVKIMNYTCSWISLEDNLGVTWQSHARWQYIDNSWPDWSLYYAIHLECDVPQAAKSFPLSVVVYVTSQDDIRVEIPVETALEGIKQLPLAVCVKPITGQFSVATIVEWMEIQRLVGLEHFILYTTDLSGASQYVIEYYREIGLIETVQFPYLAAVLAKVEEHEELSPENRYAVYQQVYLVALQDALYRFYKTYKLLLVIDLDEVVLPTHQGSLLSRIENLIEKNKDGVGFLFHTAWHFEDTKPLEGIPNYLYMQKYAKSSAPVIAQPKSVLVTSQTRTLNFHAVITALNVTYRTEVLVPWEDYAYVHHYRGLCRSKFLEPACQDIISQSRMDTVIPRYLTQLKTRVKEVIDHLQLR